MTKFICFSKTKVMGLHDNFIYEFVPIMEGGLEHEDAIKIQSSSDYTPGKQYAIKIVEAD